MDLLHNSTFFQWLRSFDQRMRESIDYAICLDSIGSWENELWIHVSKPPENAFIKKIVEVSEWSQWRRLYYNGLTCSFIFLISNGKYWCRIFQVLQKN